MNKPLFIRQPSLSTKAVFGEMHLFDFNEALVGRRLLGDQRLENDMELRKVTPELSKPCRKTPQDQEEDKKLGHCKAGFSSRNVLRKMQTKEIAPHGMAALETKQRTPSVVARLMGLDTLPGETVKTKQVKKRRSERVTPKHSNDVQMQKEKHRRDTRPVLISENHCQEAVTTNGIIHCTPGQDIGRDCQLETCSWYKVAEPCEFSSAMPREEMKRQIASKQALIRKKMNEAKEIFARNKCTDATWHSSYEKLNDSKEFLNVLEFLHCNMDVFLKFLEDQDAVLTRHLQELTSVQPISQPTSIDEEEGLRRKLWSERKGPSPHAASRSLMQPSQWEEPPESASHRQSLGSRGNISPSQRQNFEYVFSGKNFRKPVVDNGEIATRIVVLKPSPGKPQNSRLVTSEAAYENLVEVAKGDGCQNACGELGSNRGGKSACNGSARGTNANPREIAREIARQVREDVVRKLAKSSTTVSNPCLLSSNSNKNMKSHKNDAPAAMKESSTLHQWGFLDENGTKSTECLGFKEATNAALTSSGIGKFLQKENSKLEVTGKKEHQDATMRQHQKKALHYDILTQSYQTALPSAKKQSKGIVVLVPESQVRRESKHEKTYKQTEAKQLREERRYQFPFVAPDHSEFDGCGNYHQSSLKEPSNHQVACDAEHSAIVSDSFSNDVLDMPMSRGVSLNTSAMRDYKTSSGSLYSSSSTKVPLTTGRPSCLNSYDSVTLNDHLNKGKYQQAAKQSSCSNGSFLFGLVQTNLDDPTGCSSSEDVNTDHSDTPSECPTVDMKGPAHRVFDLHSLSDLSPISCHESLSAISLSPVDDCQEQALNSPTAHPPLICEKYVQKSTIEASVVALTDGMLPKSVQIHQSVDSQVMTNQEICSLADGARPEPLEEGSEISSENSCQPSPVSVLDSSFEESPSTIDFRTISSDLQELRMHLQLLRSEEQEQIDYSEPCKDSLTDKFHTLQSRQVEISKRLEAIGHGFADWDDFPCSEGRKEELLYVKNLLATSDYDDIIFNKCSSPSHLFDPSLFDKVEAQYCNSGSETLHLAEGCNSVSKRRLLFHVVDEILLQKFEPCVSLHSLARTAKAKFGSFSTGKQLLKEIWLKLCDYMPPEDPFHNPAEVLIEQYLNRGDNWLDVEKESHNIGLDIEGSIFNDLIEESVIEFVSL